MLTLEKQNEENKNQVRHDILQQDVTPLVNSVSTLQIFGLWSKGLIGQWRFALRPASSRTNRN